VLSVVSLVVKTTSINVLCECDCGSSHFSCHFVVCFECCSHDTPITVFYGVNVVVQTTAVTVLCVVSVVIMQPLSLC
jgi:low affinity Fe/Cu permease